MNPQVPPDQGNAIQELLALWKRRSQQAFPVDAMTINKCIRELEECIAYEPATIQSAKRGEWLIAYLARDCTDLDDAIVACGFEKELKAFIDCQLIVSTM